MSGGNTSLTYDLRCLRLWDNRDVAGGELIDVFDLRCWGLDAFSTSDVKDLTFATFCVGDIEVLGKWCEVKQENWINITSCYPLGFQYAWNEQTCMICHLPPLNKNVFITKQQRSKTEQKVCHHCLHWCLSCLSPRTLWLMQIFVVSMYGK